MSEESAQYGEFPETARIMKEIRAAVERRKAEGFYTDGEIDEIARMELALEERRGYGEEMDALISWLHAHWEATGPVDPVPGDERRPLRRWIKRLLALLMRPEARLLLGKQNQINARLVQLLSGVLPALRDGAADTEERLENAVGRLEEENRRLRARLDELEGRLRGPERPKGAGGAPEP